MDEKEYAAEAAGADEAESLPETSGAEESAAAAEAEKAPKEEDFIARDARSFQKRFPQVDLAALDGSEEFRRFCGSRYGREPLEGLFLDYLAVTRAAEERSRARADSKARRSTGTGGSGGADALTAEQQRELSEWNRAYPQMKMTAREYLRR